MPHNCREHPSTKSAFPHNMYIVYSKFSTVFTVDLFTGKSFQYDNLKNRKYYVYLISHFLELAMLVFRLYNSHYKTKGLKNTIYLFSDEINNGSTLLIIIILNKSTLT